jgi:hypothetical protein
MSDLSVPQGPEGRAPNVSPARTFLPRDAGWRIALYAVFRKENRTRDPLQRSQGGSKGTFLPRDAGWRIALYAVFVKKTALATLSSAAKGEARGRAGESIREDEMSAGGAALNLYLTVRPRLARNDSNVRPIRCSRPGGPALSGLTADGPR